MSESEERENPDAERAGIPLSEHLEAIGGELDTTELLQDLYNDPDVSIPWAIYVTPIPDDELAGKRVIDTYREYKDAMTDAQVNQLYARLQDERNRRRSRERKEADSDE